MTLIEKEEKEEKLLHAAELQVKKAQNKIEKTDTQGGGLAGRAWFQTQRERMQEKGNATAYCADLMYQMLVLVLAAGSEATEYYDMKTANPDTPSLVVWVSKAWNFGGILCLH